MPISEAKKKADVKWRNKALKTFQVMIRKELYDEIAEYCKEKGISKAEFLRKAFENRENFLG